MNVLLEFFRVWAYDYLQKYMSSFLDIHPLK